MTERLEEIKTRFNAMKELESFKKLAPTDLFFDDLNWLLQQAERVQELEKDIENYKKACASWETIESYNRKEAKRYKQALEEVKYKYISLAPYGAEAQRDAMLEVVNKLRKALEREG